MSGLYRAGRSNALRVGYRHYEERRPDSHRSSRLQQGGIQGDQQHAGSVPDAANGPWARTASSSSLCMRPRLVGLTRRPSDSRVPSKPTIPRSRTRHLPEQQVGAPICGRAGHERGVA